MASDIFRRRRGKKKWKTTSSLSHPLTTSLLVSIYIWTKAASGLGDYATRIAVVTKQLSSEHLQDAPRRRRLASHSAGGGEELGMAQGYTTNWEFLPRPPSLGGWLVVRVRNMHLEGRGSKGREGRWKKLLGFIFPVRLVFLAIGERIHFSPLL